MEEGKHGRDRFKHPLFGVVLRNEHLNIMYKEQFFPGVNVSSSELKPGEPEAVEEPHKPESEEQNSVRRINRRNFTLEDYAREWDIHPEWHGLSTQQATSKEGTASGLGAFTPRQSLRRDSDGKCEHSLSIRQSPLRETLTGEKKMVVEKVDL